MEDKHLCRTPGAEITQKEVTRQIANIVERFYTRFFLDGGPRSMMQCVRDHCSDHKLVGAEIGVQYGYNARNILRGLNIERLYLIDPYLPYLDEKTYMDSTFQKKAEKKCKSFLKKYNNKIVSIKKRAEDATKDVPDNLDFVYIDGDHRYDFVKKDIEMYYPKVREGGVIGGHDFTTPHLGVIRAAIEFADKHKIRLYAQHIDWWIIK